jgi:hypothetical protein
MILSLDVRRARKGDCLILHYGTKEDPGLVLIDGGPSQVYTPQLKPRLAQIRKARDLAADDPLAVNLMMVSHIDDDHINGILELTKELITATDERKPLPLKVRDLWHNSFDDIIGNSPKELLASVTASFGAAGLMGELDSEGFDAHTAKVLASVGQGFHLRDDARKLKLPVNKEFGGGLVMADKKDPIDFGKGLQFTVAGPMKAELLALQKEHDAFLKTEENKKNKAALASFTDTSVANLSSLVLLAEVDKKRILLTGDARGDKILQGLEQVKLLAPGGKMHIEILKVPHHGSDRNMETGFFERVTADHYVFSGNGEHGNPERETLKMLLEARGDANYTVHLTYPVNEIDVGRKADWEKEQAKEKVKKQSKPNAQVREDWSPDKHSVTAFLSANQEFARRISVVAQDKPHVIDLHDALGY